MSSEPTLVQPSASSQKKNHFLEWHNAAESRGRDGDAEQELLAMSAMSAYRNIEAAVAIGRTLLPEEKLTISHTIEIARFINQIQVESVMEDDDEDEDASPAANGQRQSAPGHYGPGR